MKLLNVLPCVPEERGRGRPGAGRRGRGRCVHGGRVHSGAAAASHGTPGATRPGGKGRPQGLWRGGRPQTSWFPCTQTDLGLSTSSIVRGLISTLLSHPFCGPVNSGSGKLPRRGAGRQRGGGKARQEGDIAGPGGQECPLHAAMSAPRAPSGRRVLLIRTPQRQHGVICVCLEFLPGA